MHYQQDLLAAPAACRVGFRQVAHYRFCNGAQYNVAAFVSVGVVDLLKVVDIAHYNAERFAAMFQFDQFGVEAVSVIKSGECVVGRSEIQTIVGCVQLLYKGVYLQNEQAGESEQQNKVEHDIDGAH